MDLDALIQQTQDKMMKLNNSMDSYSKGIEEHKITMNAALDIITESTESAKESMSQNQILVNQLAQRIESLGATTNSKITELDERLSDFAAKIESIEEGINSKLTAYSEVMTTSSQSTENASQIAITSSSDYLERVKELERSFNDTISTMDQDKETINTSIVSTIEKTTVGFDESVENLSGLKNLLTTRTDELTQKLTSMMEAAKSLSEDLLDSIKSLHQEKLSTIESIIGLDIVNQITEGGSSWKEATETLKELGLDDIAQYTSKIEEVLGFTEKVQDIYDEIKPVIELIA